MQFTEESPSPSNAGNDSLMPNAIETYNNLVSKLERRRFALRRPNHEELTEQLNVLQDQFNTGGNLRYAAFCALAIARCERAMSDVLGEAQAFANAGHTFYMAELERSSSNSPCFEEYVGEATSCYLVAVSLYRSKDMCATAASLYHELATLLQRLGKSGEAASFFLKAAEMHQSIDQYHTAMSSLWLAVDSSVTQCDYITAGVTLNWIIKLASEVPDINDSLEGSTRQGIAPKTALGTTLKQDLITEALLTLVLLLLLQGDFQQAKDYLCKLSETANSNSLKSSPEISSPSFSNSQSSSEFMTLLSDLVTSVETGDNGSVCWCQRELWSIITPRQNELVLRLSSRRSLPT